MSNFPGEARTVRRGRFECKAYSQVLSEKKSIVANHLQHQEKKTAQAEDVERRNNF